MNCLKCGRETASEQIFCQECLLEMEKYPVKPGTVVQLPQRREMPAVRRPKRRILTSEEQIRHLQRRIRIMAALLFISTLLIIGLLIPTIEHLMEEEYRPGQNYTSIVSKAPETGGVDAEK